MFPFHLKKKLCICLLWSNLYCDIFWVNFYLIIIIFFFSFKIFHNSFYLLDSYVKMKENKYEKSNAWSSLLCESVKNVKSFPDMEELRRLHWCRCSKQAGGKGFFVSCILSLPSISDSWPLTLMLHLLLSWRVKWGNDIQCIRIWLV